MTRTFNLISSVTALMLATAAALLSVPGRTSSLYSGIQLLASRADPAITALSDSIAEHPSAMMPP